MGNKQVDTCLKKLSDALRTAVVAGTEKPVLSTSRVSQIKK